MYIGPCIITKEKTPRWPIVLGLEKPFVLRKEKDPFGYPVELREKNHH